MNIIFFAIVSVAFLTAGWRQLNWTPVNGDVSPMKGLTDAMIESAAGSVELALGLVGVMTLFLGLMKVAEAGGLLTILARLIRPLMVRLFPRGTSRPSGHGGHDLESISQCTGFGQRSHPLRHSSHAGA